MTAAAGSEVPAIVVNKAMEAQLALLMQERDHRQAELDASGESEDSLEQTGKMAPKSFLNDPFILLDQMGLNYRSMPSSLTFETLRQITERNVIVAAVVQTRIMQVYSACQPQRNKYSVGFVVEHVDPTRRLTPEEKSEVAYINRFLLNCGEGRPYGRDTFDTFIKKTVRDRLTYDQTAAEIVGKFSGKPHEFTHVPADTIRLRRMASRWGRPQTEEEWRNYPRYVQIIDGVQVNDYTEDELMFGIANPRTDLRGNGYGWSELEMLITTVTSQLWAEQWNQRIFSQGSTTKGVLNFAGKVPKDQLEAFRRHWFSLVTGVNNAWRTPVTNVEKLEWIPMQMSNTDMGYQEWLQYLIKCIAAVYLIDPAEINFDVRGGVGQQPMFMTTNEAQQKVSKDRGLQPLMRHLSDLLTRNIVQRINPNYVFAFRGLDAQGEAQAVELRMKEAQTYKTLNEIRAGEDLDPVANGDLVMNPVYIGYVQQKEMMAAAPPPGADAGGGAPGGAPVGPPPQMPGLPGSKESKQQAAPPPPEEASEAQHAPDRSVDDWEFSIHASLQNELKKALEVFDDLET